jgi:predicted DNA-binding protein (MmcQ/YjbR family)
MIGSAEVQSLALALGDATHAGLFRDGLDVYRVRNKVFAVCGERYGLTFKATEIAYAVLTEDGPGRPAPGFVPGKGSWVNVPLQAIAAEDAESWLATSYRLVARSLTRKARAELGFPVEGTGA